MLPKITDYLLTPRDIVRGLSRGLKRLRPEDVRSIALFLLLLALVRRYLKWGTESLLVLAGLFALSYWDNPLRRRLLRLRREMTLDDVTGLFVVFTLSLILRDYLSWRTDTIIFILLLVASLYWNPAARTLLRWSFLFLLLCPLLLLLSGLGSETAAGWLSGASQLSFYFLAFGYIKQLSGLRRSG